MSDSDDRQKQAILNTLQAWAQARGCGTLRERMNAALDELEAEAPLSDELFQFAYAAAKRIIDSQRVGRL